VEPVLEGTEVVGITEVRPEGEENVDVVGTTEVRPDGEEIVDVGVTEVEVGGVAVVSIGVDRVTPEVVEGIMDVPDVVTIVIDEMVGGGTVAVVGSSVVIGGTVDMVVAPETPVVTTVVGIPGAVVGEPGHTTVGGNVYPP